MYNYKNITLEKERIHCYKHNWMNMNQRKKNSQLTPNNTNDTTESDNQELTIIKLQEELEYYKEKNQQLE